MTRNDEKFAAQKIREKYVDSKASELCELTSLDKKIHRPGKVFSYIFGSLGAIIMGSGMSLVMTDIGSKIGIADGLVPGIIIGCIGLIMALINYPIYKKITNARKKKYGDKVLIISDKILNEKEIEENGN